MQTNHLPGAQQKRFWQKKWLQESTSRVPPIIAAGISAWMVFRNEKIYDPWVFGLALTACIWLLVVAIGHVLTARTEDQKEVPDTIHEGLYAAVFTLHSMLSEWCSKRNYADDIRITFHRVVQPIEAPQEIEQIINYAGANSGGVGRRFSVHTGITGKSVRNKTTLVMSSKNRTEDDLRAELVDKWGYTEDKAQKLAPGRYSAMAIPVFDRTGQFPLGVLYLDSSDRTLFERDGMEEIVGAGAKAISDFVTKRY